MDSVKGIAHFTTGVAIATFFPGIVSGAAQGLSFGPLLGGLAALIPDTLDFKLGRYFYRQDDEIDPATIADKPGQPDPQAIAERIAAAMNRAYEEGKEVRIQLHTVRLGADLWRQWSVAFDLERSQVVVHIGPVVTTGQVPFSGSGISGLEVGRAQVNAAILPTYDAETKIDVFSGPSLAFARTGDAIEVTFLPWHRAWTHSLLMALLLGAIGFLVAPAYGLVMTLAALAHILEDQLGFMGSNLFFPITRKRTKGLKWISSGDAIPNFLTVWISLAVILLNLDRFSAAPILPVLPYVLAVIVVPGLLLLGLKVWADLRSRRQPAPGLWRIPPPAMAAVEALDETGEVDI
jgi:membrane-bound metal-dependent hydrolase YbcI (DUF457 family)